MSRTSKYFQTFPKNVVSFSFHYKYYKWLIHLSISQRTGHHNGCPIVASIQKRFSSKSLLLVTIEHQLIVSVKTELFFWNWTILLVFSFLQVHNSALYSTNGPLTSIAGQKRVISGTFSTTNVQKYFVHCWNSFEYIKHTSVQQMIKVGRYFSAYI